MEAVVRNPSSCSYDVVLICCNGSAYLREQISSILCQTVPPARLLLSDDASTDGTVSILENWQSQFPSQVMVRHESERCGVIAHVNRALAALLREGSSPYVFFADQDDLWDPDKAERSLALMARLEAERGANSPLLVHTDLRLIDGACRLLAASYVQASQLQVERTGVRDLAFQNVVTGCTMLANLACLKMALPIPPEAVLHDNWLALVASGLGAIGFVPEPTVSYRQHGANLVGGDVFSRDRLVRWIRSLREGTAAERQVQPAVDQALAFVERYGSAHPALRRSLPPDTLRTLKAGDTLGRLRAAVALRVRKHGLRRTLVWWASLLWPRRRRRPQSSPDFSPYRLRILPSAASSVGSPPRPRLLHALANVQTGGSTRLVVDLVEGLSARLQQRVLTSYLPDPPEYEGLPVDECPSRASLASITAAIRGFAPHLIHVHYWGGCDRRWYRQVFRAAESLGVPVIQNINTPVAPFPSRVIVANVYVSAFVRQTFALADPLAQVIYPGCDFSLFDRSAIAEDARQDLLRSLFGDGQGPVVGMVYRLEPDKLSANAIEAFLAIVRCRPQTRCLIVGDGSLLRAFRDRVRQEDLQHSFHFTGYVAYQKLPALYSLMDLFLAPVWSESFGQVSPFAMAMGVPVVGYNVGGLPEILGQQGLLAPPGNAEALADIAVELLDDPARRSQLALGLSQRALGLFSVQAMVDAYANLYQQYVRL